MWLDGCDEKSNVLLLFDILPLGELILFAVELECAGLFRACAWNCFDFDFDLAAAPFNINGSSSSVASEAKSDCSSVSSTTIEREEEEDDGRWDEEGFDDEVPSIAD